MDISQLLLKQGIDPTESARAPWGAGSTNGASRPNELKAAALKFESVFVHQILKQVQETIENASFDPEDSSNQQVHGMYCNFLSDMIAQNGGFGLWEKIYEQMARTEYAPGQAGQEGAVVSLNEKA